MWHWNTTWWSHPPPEADRAIDEPPPWTPAGLMSVQARYWEQALAANRDWWRLVMSSFALPALPPAGVVVAPDDQRETADEIDDAVDAAPAADEPPPAAARRRSRPGTRTRQRRKPG